MHLVGLSTHCNMMHGTYNVKFKAILKLLNLKPGTYPVKKYSNFSSLKDTLTTIIISKSAVEITKLHISMCIYI